MDDSEQIVWVEEHTGQPPVHVGVKRKAKTKKMQYVGWGSRPLIEFLEQVGIDTSKQISQYDVADIVNKYVNDQKLLHPDRKKRILCDEWLLSLFGRKNIARNKIYDMLDAHFVANQVDSDDDFLFSSDEDGACESQKKFTLKRKPSEKVLKAPKSEFAAIIPDNIKLIYLKKSLVQELVHDSETSEDKLVGSIVRVKSDPYDYLQKNSHMLVQVLGLKKITGSDTEIVLRVSNIMKDVHISILSEDNFSEEECNDLHQRMRNDLLKKLTVVELEKKVEALHQDITNHWLAKELALLQKQIDRANEKGWRRELSGYLERMQLLQTPDEQARLLREVPNVIAEEIEVEGAVQQFPDSIEKQDLASPKSTLNINGGWKISKQGVAGKETQSASVPFALDSADFQHSIVLEGEQKQLTDVITVNKDFQHSLFLEEEHKQPTNIITENKDCQRSVLFNEQKQPPDVSAENKGRHGHNVQLQPKSVMDVMVIDLSDDEDEEKSEDSSSDVEILDHDLESYIWNYMDPQGNVQGPFCVRALKRWYDDNYFPPDFKVWLTGESQKEAVTLSSMLRGIFGH
ncbi:uncharacterized protein At5g08430-like isoform X2 [Euphorbia lathyris]|uniref:uncharacterized protein At5g08430-like isoform X2 n=1 Tax=Euphorbia lathyris TaxID=212925 RepID=UPI0033137AEA